MHLNANVQRVQLTSTLALLVARCCIQHEISFEFDKFDNVICASLKDSQESNRCLLFVTETEVWEVRVIVSRPIEGRWVLRLKYLRELGGGLLGILLLCWCLATIAIVLSRSLVVVVVRCLSLDLGSLWFICRSRFGFALTMNCQI